MVQYTDVEKFEPYELTSCLAYEMAIRNRTVEGLIINHHNNPEYTGNKLFHSFYLTKFYFNYHFINWCIDMEHHNEVLKKRFEVGEEIYEYDENGEKIKNLINKKKGYCINTKIADGITISNTICPTFKRPKLEPYRISKDVQVELNLALPEKELIEYIKLIKKDFDTNNNISKTGYEVYEDLIFENGEKIKPRDILTNGLYAADMFFIYDCINLGYRNFDIRNEIYNYYSEVKGITTRTMTDKSIRKYYKTAVEYIDKLKYKELVTGIKLEEINKRKNLNFILEE